MAMSEINEHSGTTPMLKDFVNYVSGKTHKVFQVEPWAMSAEKNALPNSFPTYYQAELDRNSVELFFFLFAKEALKDISRDIEKKENPEEFAPGITIIFEALSIFVFEAVSRDVSIDHGDIEVAISHALEEHGMTLNQVFHTKSKEKGDNGKTPKNI